MQVVLVLGYDPGSYNYHLTVHFISVTNVMNFNKSAVSAFLHAQYRHPDFKHPFWLMAAACNTRAKMSHVHTSGYY